MIDPKDTEHARSASPHRPTRPRSRHAFTRSQDQDTTDQTEALPRIDHRRSVEETDDPVFEEALMQYGHEQRRHEPDTPPPPPTPLTDQPDDSESRRTRYNPSISSEKARNTASRRN